MVNINFINSVAQLSKLGKHISARWSIDKDQLVFDFSGDVKRSLTLIKAVSNDDLIIVKESGSNVPSILVKDENLAYFVLNSWQKISSNLSN
jgi:hypothetical protein